MRLGRAAFITDIGKKCSWRVVYWVECVRDGFWYRYCCWFISIMYEMLLWTRFWNSQMTIKSFSNDSQNVGAALSVARWSKMLCCSGQKTGRCCLTLNVEHNSHTIQSHDSKAVRKDVGSWELLYRPIKRLKSSIQCIQFGLARWHYW